MKTKNLLLFILIFFCKIGFGQVTAGSVPGGMSIINPNVNLSRTVAATDTITSFDIDCDGINDISIRLYSGRLEIDIPNAINLYVLNHSFEICTDSGTKKMTFYNQGDTLCAGSHLWIPDTSYNICYGGFICKGPGSILNKYIAYKKIATQEVGWIKISFQIQGPLPLTLSINEVLALCDITRTSQLQDDLHFKLIPNPFTLSSTLHLTTQLNNTELTIYDMLGKEMMRKRFSGDKTEINRGNLASGIYFIKVNTEDKQWVQKIVVE